MELVTVADAARVGGGADLGGPKIGDAGLGALGGATGIVGARPGGNLVYAGHGAAERGGVEGLGGSELGGLGALGGATGIVGVGPGGNLVYAGNGAAERGGVEGLGGSELGDGLGNSDLGGLGGMLGAEKGV